MSKPMIIEEVTTLTNLTRDPDCITLVQDLYEVYTYMESLGMGGTKVIAYCATQEEAKKKAKGTGDYGGDASIVKKTCLVVGHSGAKLKPHYIVPIDSLFVVEPVQSRAQEVLSKLTEEERRIINAHYKTLDR